MNGFTRKFVQHYWKTIEKLLVNKAIQWSLPFNGERLVSRLQGNRQKKIKNQLICCLYRCGDIQNI